jgi:hypothetical protein
MLGQAGDLFAQHFLQADNQFFQFGVHGVRCA